MSESPNIYLPSRTLGKRIRRRLTPLQSRRLARFKLTRPIISFTFDDCPVSALEHGVKPLNDQGHKSTIYIAAGLLGSTNHLGLHMNADEVISAHENGHEIGGHSYSHQDLSELSLNAAQADLARDRKVIADLGLPASRSFAYPYGQTTPQLKQELETHYTGMRGIAAGIMHEQADLNQIRSTPLFDGPSFEMAIAQIKSLSTRPGWLTLFTHDIQDSPTPWGCTPGQMEAAITAAISVDALILPVADAIDKIQEHTT